jgi:hypothetical protein
MNNFIQISDDTWINLNTIVEIVDTKDTLFFYFPYLDFTGSSRDYRKTSPKYYKLIKNQLQEVSHKI